VTFDHPPINTITATTVAELGDLVGLIEQDPDLRVVVFDIANPDFYLAHYDLENDPSRTEALGGGPMARLSRLVGRGRALEILLVADDLDGPRAEQYGYVNRLIADDQLEAEVEAIASRLARFDHDAIARTKSYVDQVTLPDNSELGPPWNDFLELFRRPAQQAQSARLRELGLNTNGEFERSLGRRLVESFPDA
jgi:enoyl-CoA hydratase/carnithine racemase